MSQPNAPPSETLQVWIQEAANLKAALDEHAIVAITDPQGEITFVNDKFCAISKYSREELLGQDHRIVNSGHHPKEFFRDLWETSTHGRAWHGEIKNRGKDGCCYWVATTIVPFLDTQGTPQRFVAIGADITEQKRIEAELAEKLRLQGVLASISTLFVALPSEEVNEAIEEMQRLVVEAFSLDRCTMWQQTETGSGMVCTHCWQRPGYPTLPPEFGTKDNLPWAYAKLMRGESVSLARLEELPPEAAHDAAVFGIHGPRSSLTFPLLINGQTFGALAFGTMGAERDWREDEILELKLIAQIVGNVVGRQRAELREVQLRGELAHALRVATLGELVSALAHELNQPLSAILSNAQAARRFLKSGQIDQAEFTAILDDIVRDDKRAGNVIHSLRAMVSKRPVVHEICDANELVEEVANLMHGELIDAKIRLRLVLAPALPPLNGARVELEQVLMNLLVNAVHAMEGTPLEFRSIEVETRGETDSVGITVRDHGLGIPADRVSAIFEPFYSTKASGLGMGLAICRRIVENHGGRIEVRHGEHGGAVFSFSLPAALG